MWATLDAQLLALIPSFQKLPLLVRRNLTPFSNNTTMTRWQMKFYGVIIMSANFMTPWTFGGTKKGSFSTMFQLLPMIGIYNMKAWSKWRMDITLKQKLRQLHHNLLKNVNQKFHDQKPYNVCQGGGK